MDALMHVCVQFICERIVILGSQNVDLELEGYKDAVVSFSTSTVVCGAILWAGYISRGSGKQVVR
jgi:hypothetical protein